MPRSCEGEVGFVLDRDSRPELEESGPMHCSEGHILDHQERDRMWNAADDRAFEWEIASAEAIVESSAEAHYEAHR